MAAHSNILAWRIPMDRGACWAMNHGVAKSQTQVKGFSTALDRRLFQAELCGSATSTSPEMSVNEDLGTPLIQIYKIRISRVQGAEVCILGASLAVLCLRHHALNVGVTGLIHGWGTNILHAAQGDLGKKKKKKSKNKYFNKIPRSFVCVLHFWKHCYPSEAFQGLPQGSLLL